MLGSDAVRVDCHRPVHYERRRPEETVLYQTLQGHLETFIPDVEADGERALPRFVKKELRDFLDCGILAKGSSRVRCARCRHDRVVAFSCKHRGFCPSCGGRRMAETAANLTDHVIPEVPVRQWVNSLPHAIRYRLAYDHEACTIALQASCAPSSPICVVERGEGTASSTASPVGSP